METAQVYLEIRILAAIITKMTHRALKQRLDKAGIDVSGLQFKILGALYHQEQTISELSHTFMLDPSTLVPAVDALERKGLAKRGKDPRDRRRVPLSLTERGSEFIACIPLSDNDDPLVQGLDALGEERSRQLLTLLRELVGNMPEGEHILQKVSSRLQSHTASAFTPKEQS